MIRHCSTTEVIMSEEFECSDGCNGDVVNVEVTETAKLMEVDSICQISDSGVDDLMSDEDVVVIEGTSASTASSSIRENYRVEYVCYPVRLFSSALVAKRKLGLNKTPVLIRSLNKKKGKSKSIQKDARLHVVVTKKEPYVEDDMIYFAIPRDLKVVCYSFEKREITEEAKKIYGGVSVLREYTDETSSFRSLERAYDSTRIEELSVELAPISCPNQVLQQEYDQLFPGISTISYLHDHHWANQGDIDVDITVLRMEIDFTKWYLPPKIFGSVSGLRRAQGGLNPQTPLALVGSAMQRNFEVEYQATAQSVRRSAAKALSLIGVRYPDGRNFLHVLDEYQKDPLTVINDDAFAKYISKQRPEAIERIAVEDLGDEFIKYHVHCLMNKDTTKPKLDGSIATTTPVVQTIVYNQQYMNARVSPQFEILTRRLMDLLGPEVQMFIGKSIPELEKFINDNVYFGGEFPTWGDADGSKFDKLQQEFALLCELYLYKLLGWRGFDFDKWFEAVDHKSMLSYRAKLRLQLAFQRSSGNRNTALGNSIVMLLAVFSKVNIEYDQLLCAINLGDDITFAIHGPINLDGFDDATMVKTLDDELWLPLLQKAVEVRNPHLANSNVRLIARAMKTLSVDSDVHKELNENLTEHY
ncbi:hypothetical protein G6F57_013371 [Rhizopus arrhizus]|uniref:RdRp catalytic domain-containing protein n=1 Tax=Rhizopus oryzae TaxID=64495 RepID=A0A9P7C3G5_RHIOR|nr:hypothetical protein G6F23_009899 [Rhizopus arrhizus]KAG1257230.1 hypothetical protein G6F68_009412 [Rhizopus microsporus]KAG1399969.1 hypothetical protein G6F58_011030 [Rhizopus delemar]KAG0754770.1 hypothetical protein G6F24_012267 [Rhizopus arrhizus]KAG0780496.1 hypothetical protein G6F21_012109 [Rhizopus arrhizus]